MGDIGVCYNPDNFPLVINRGTVHVVADKKPGCFLDAGVHVHEHGRVFHVVFYLLFRKGDHFVDVEKNGIVSIVSPCNFSPDYQPVYRSRAYLDLIVEDEVLCVPEYPNYSIAHVRAANRRKADLGSSRPVNYNVVFVDRDYGFMFELLDPQGTVCCSHGLVPSFGSGYPFYQT